MPTKKNRIFKPNLRPKGGKLGFKWILFLSIAISGYLHGYENHEQYRPPQGQIWSLLPLKNTLIGDWWSQTYPQLEQQFPDMRFTPPEDLHLSIIIVGSWQFDDLPRIKSLAMVAPKEAIHTALSLALLGVHDQWLALKLINIPTEWKQAVEAANLELVAEGLKKPGRFDRDFAAHISLATPKTTPHPPYQRQEPLAEEEQHSLELLKEQLTKTVSNLHFDLSVQEAQKLLTLWLTDAVRPPDYPHYIPLNDWLKIYAPQLLRQPQPVGNR